MSETDNISYYFFVDSLIV